MDKQQRDMWIHDFRDSLVVLDFPQFPQSVSCEWDYEKAVFNINLVFDDFDYTCAVAPSGLMTGDEAALQVVFAVRNAFKQKQPKSDNVRIVTLKDGSIMHIVDNDSEDTEDGIA